MIFDRLVARFLIWARFDSLACGASLNESASSNELWQFAQPCRCADIIADPAGDHEEAQGAASVGRPRHSFLARARIAPFTSMNPESNPPLPANADFRRRTADSVSGRRLHDSNFDRPARRPQIYNIRFFRKSRLLRLSAYSSSRSSSKREENHSSKTSKYAKAPSPYVLAKREFSIFFPSSL